MLIRVLLECCGVIASWRVRLVLLVGTRRKEKDR